MFEPRPSQAEVLEYRSGKMGVSAVPGSGKTHTLSYLAYQLLSEENLLLEDQEILIVTLVNSAVENFNSRVAGFMQKRGLLPGLGYRVRTLHGLAHDIVRERPDLAGLSSQFQILDERDTGDIIQSAAIGWVHSHPEQIELLTNPEVSSYQAHNVKKGWEELIVDIARNFIRQAKDLQITPRQIKEKLERTDQPYFLLEMGCEVYSVYQRMLSVRSAVDFDDLIRLALSVLHSDPDYLARLRFRWPYILEDEAQDSNLLQEEILRLLAGENGNWVRVGDPNQAIYETFTTASPEYLRNFLKTPGVTAKNLIESGRSSQGIMDLANFLVRWSRSPDNPNIDLHDALANSNIERVPPKYPQQNPDNVPNGITLYGKKLSADEELTLIAKSLKNWLPQNSDKTAAVLVPSNHRGVKMVDELKKYGVETVELLRSSLSTRQTTAVISTILKFLAEPSSSTKLSAVYRVIMEKDLGINRPDIAEQIRVITTLIQKCTRLEDYLAPHPGQDWIQEQIARGESQEILEELQQFRLLINRWQDAVILPADQLILTIALEIFSSPFDLALIYKLAIALARSAQFHPNWSLIDFIGEMEAIIQNRNKFEGFSSEDMGFNPDEHKGKVVIATIHKAKGLEWDRVYLPSMNNYDFPFAVEGDSFISEKWFVRDQHNLQAITIEQLKALAKDDLPGIFDEETATLNSRIQYAAERLRLLYVGITRARQELVLTWNTGRQGKCTPSIPFSALLKYWNERENP